MKRKIKIILLLTVFLILAFITAAGIAYRATLLVPEEYARVVEISADEAETLSQQALKKATALASDIQNVKRWETLFSESEINGWLAGDFVNNHRDAIPRSLKDPRVVFEENKVTFFCRAQKGSWDSVLSLTLSVAFQGPNQIAFRIHKMRSGMLPLPQWRFKSTSEYIARRLKWPLRWEHVEGDLVALLTIVPERLEEGRRIVVDDVRVGDREIYLSGTSKE